MHLGTLSGADIISAGSMVSWAGLGRGQTAETLDSGLSPALEGLRAVPERPRRGLGEQMGVFGGWRNSGIHCGGEQGRDGPDPGSGSMQLPRGACPSAWNMAGGARQNLFPSTFKSSW